MSQHGSRTESGISGTQYDDIRLRIFQFLLI